MDDGYNTVKDDQTTSSLPPAQKSSPPPAVKPKGITKKVWRRLRIKAAHKDKMALVPLPQPKDGMGNYIVKNAEAKKKKRTKMAKASRRKNR